MKNVVILSNPPYNDGTQGRTPIYDNFLEEAILLTPAKSIFILPTNWFSQNHNSFGKKIRNYLVTLGVYRIVINPVDMFENAKVSTCTVYCLNGYVGSIIMMDKVSGKERVIDNFYDQIINEFDEVTLAILARLKPIEPYKLVRGDKTNNNLWRIGTSYKKENFHIEPLNSFRILPPNHKSPGGYVVVATFSSEKKAKDALPKINSFWKSRLVSFILRKTRTSTTLDRPQLRYVPIITSYDSILDDSDIEKLFSLSEKEKKKIYAI